MTSKLYTIVAVPVGCGDKVPYSYEEDGFVRWVDEVFMEGYKQSEDAPFPDVTECLELIESLGYTVEIL